MFVVETQQGDLPHVRHVCRSKNIALKAARSFMTANTENGVVFVSGLSDDSIEVLVRDRDITGHDGLEEMTFDEWEQT